jgi:hypothetical protein
MSFDYSMELEGLARSNLERPRSMLIRNLVHLEPLVRQANTARHSDSDHEAVGRLNTLSLMLVPYVTVILLIDAMELGQLGVTGCQCTRARILKSLRNGTT